jgi:hypothetical protein
MDNISAFPAYSTNSNNSTASLFEARKNFEEKTLPYVLEKYNIIASDLYKQNMFYGLIDYDGDIVVPKNINTNFESIGSSDGKPILIQNFMAEAFNGFTDYLKKLSITGRISEDSPFFSIKPTSGFNNIDSLYVSNSLIAANKFKNQSKLDKKFNSSIKDPLSFNKKYCNFLKRFIQLAPITKSETVLFYNLKTFSSGLSISISSDDPGDDINKYLKFYLDDSFNCYAEACLRFGFKIDKRIPWYLTADLESPAWTKITSGHTGYFNKYGILSSKHVFDTRYEKVYKQDLNALKIAFYNSYVLFLEDNYIYEEDQDNLCSLDLLNNNFYNREAISSTEYFKLFDDSYWIKIYAYFRNLETKKGLTQTQFDGIVRQSQTMARHGMIQQAMKKLNDIFKTSRTLQQKDGVIQDIATTMTEPEIFI